MGLLVVLTILQCYEQVCRAWTAGCAFGGRPSNVAADRKMAILGCNNKKTNGLGITPLIYDPDFFQGVEAAEQPLLRNR